MRLDHISYVASHDQISDVVNRIGSQIGTAFIDGGIHPKFGTRNFTAPLLEGKYIEVVCPMDHPATDLTPFGRAVKAKSNSGGGWLSWVIATDSIEKIENKLDRKATIGVRKRPDGSELQWKQIGVLDTLDDYQNPFYIQWLVDLHPSKDGVATSSISKIKIVGSYTSVSKNIEVELDLGSTELQWINPEHIENETGIISIDFNVNNNLVTIT